MIVKMRDMAKLIVEYYEKIQGQVIMSPTPAHPGTTFTKAKDEDKMINIEEYRSLVGKILYYSTKIAPECCNAARELSQYVSGPTEEHWRAMRRMVGYLKGKEKHELILRKPKTMEIVTYADSNYATNPDDRKSISGNVITIGGSAIAWKSKKQATVALSSTEEDYISICTATQDTKFVIILLQEMKLHKAPATIMEDNT